MSRTERTSLWIFGYALLCAALLVACVQSFTALFSSDAASMSATRQIVSVLLLPAGTLVALRALALLIRASFTQVGSLEQELTALLGATRTIPERHALSEQKPPPTTERQVERTQEIRLGVVMYGGVSLAIYTYGVARELADAVQDRSATYRALKELLASDIEVDIVSGTSAGGVNGVLLGRALATGGSMEPCAKLWRDKGDLLSLLQDPLDPVERATDRKLRALFRSEEAYERELAKALAQIKRIDPVDHRARELDVFLTGTDLRGRVWTEMDARRQAISVKDHRAVFHLKHRGNGRDRPRKSAFEDTGLSDDDARCNGLAAIARVTSAFPVAFHPVDFENTGRDTNAPLASYHDLMERTLRGRWPGKRQLVDGGVLDNKPFTHALKPILFRATDRTVERKMFYVDPDPEKFGETMPREYLPDEIAVAALTSLPRYETIADDLQQIRAHNRRVRIIDSLTKGLKPDGEGSEQAKKLYASARAAGIATAIEAEIAEAPLDSPFDDDEAQSLHDAIVAILLDNADAMDEFDVFFEQRRHLHVIYAVYEEFAKTSERATPEQREILRILYRQLEKLEVAEMGIRMLVRTLAVEEEDILHQKEKRDFVLLLADRAEALLTVASEEVEPEQLHADLKARATSAHPEARGRGLLATIHQETEKALAAQVPRSRSEQQPWKAWCEFEQMDRLVYPLHSTSGVLEKDDIDLIRISPFDINVPEGAGYTWGLGPQDKIGGDALFHFGGFVKRSWRSNDIFWGRLDARSILIDSLCDPKRLHLLAKASRLEACVGRAVEQLTELTTEKERHQLMDAVKKLGHEAREDDFEAFATLAKTVLTNAGAREVFLSGAPDVVEDRARDDGASTNEARNRAEAVATTMRSHQIRREFSQLENEGRRAVDGLGSEDLGDVAPERVLRVASQTAYLLLRMLRFRFESTGARFRLIANFFALLERLAAVAYVLGRGMELGLRAHVLLLASLTAAVVASVVIVAIAWTPRDSILALVIVAGLIGAFELVRRMLVWRLRTALRKNGSS